MIEAHSEAFFSFFLFSMFCVKKKYFSSSEADVVKCLLNISGVILSIYPEVSSSINPRLTIQSWKRPPGEATTTPY